MIASVTIAKKRKMSLNVMTRLSMIASGRLNAEMAIMKARAVPRGTPF